MAKKATENTEQRKIVYIPIDKLKPHKDNPRKDLGDLTELADSIKVKGVLQNLTVVDNGDDSYTTIIGHRRCAAAKLAGLTELPCVIADMDEKEQIETMLLENIQRNDLTIKEQADGFQLMFDMGESVKMIAEKTGFSQTTVRKRLNIAKLDPKLLVKACGRQVSFGDFDKLEQIEDIKKRNDLLNIIGTSNFDYRLQQALRNQAIEKDKVLWRKLLTTCKWKFIEAENSNNLVFLDSVSDTKNVSVESIKEAFKEKYPDGNIPTGLLFSFWDSWDKVLVRFYREQTEEEQKEQSSNDRRISQEERIRDEKKKRLQEAEKTAYKCRQEFIKNWSPEVCNIQKKELAKFLTLRTLESITSDDYYSTNVYELAEMCNIHIPDKEDDDEELHFLDISDEVQKLSIEKLLVITIYLTLDDRESMSNYNIWQKFAYSKNRVLGEVYDFLESIGYEMSDTELALQNGTFFSESTEGAAE